MQDISQYSEFSDKELDIVAINKTSISINISKIYAISNILPESVSAEVKLPSVLVTSRIYGVDDVSNVGKLSRMYINDNESVYRVLCVVIQI